MREPERDVEDPDERQLDAVLGKFALDASQRADVVTSLAADRRDDPLGDRRALSWLGRNGHADHLNDELVEDREEEWAPEVQHLGRAGESDVRTDASLDRGGNHLGPV